MNISSECVMQLTEFPGCRITSFTLQYLWLRLGFFSLPKSNWLPLIQKMEGGLSGLKVTLSVLDEHLLAALVADKFERDSIILLKLACPWVWDTLSFGRSMQKPSRRFRGPTCDKL